MFGNLAHPLGVDAPNRDQGHADAPGHRVSQHELLDAHRWFRPLLARGRENGTKGDIVGRLLEGALELDQRMRGDSDPQPRRKALDQGRGKIALAQVHPGRTAELREIHPVIDDEFDPTLTSGLDQGVEHGEDLVARCSLRSQLQPAWRGVERHLRNFQWQEPVLPTDGEIDDGVEAARGGHGVGASMARWYLDVMPRRFLMLLALAAGVPLATPALAVAPSPEEAELLGGLLLHVREAGPQRPWVVAIENATTRPVYLVKDPRLLSMTVKVPGKRKDVDCSLPAAMLPAKAEQERLREVAPGEELRFRIDPRFYCVDGDEGVLVPGAMIEATYGFRGATRTSYRAGRKVTERLPSTPPYVAQFPSEADEAARQAALPPPGPPVEANDETATDDQEPRDAEGEDDAQAPTPPPPVEHDQNRPGLRAVKPTRLALGSEYQSWEPKTGDDDLTRGLVLEVIDGSDSLTARGAQVTVRITNRGHRPQRLFVRRELISYYLLGPEGLSVCAADEAERAPDGQSFRTLAPDEKIQFTTRLVEFCPGEIIDRPGFYLVGAELAADGASNEPGIDAFQGVLYTTRGKPVRIQKGELPFVYRNVPRAGLSFIHDGKMLRSWAGARAEGKAHKSDTDGAEGGADAERDVFTGNEPESD